MIAYDDLGREIEKDGFVTVYRDINDEAEITQDCD